MLKDLLLTFLSAMLPVFELRGAIPLGLAKGLPTAEVFLAAAAGNMVPVLPVILLSRRLLAFGRRFPLVRHFCDWLEKHAVEKGRIVAKYRAIGLVLLVAIPLPGTGAWTGAVVAAIMNLRMKMSLPAILLGVLIAGCIVTAVSLGIIR